MHHAIPQHTSTTSCALKGGMSTLCVALGDMHQHQPNATGSVTDTASLRSDETARSCNFASFKLFFFFFLSFAQLSRPQHLSRGGAPGHLQVPGSPAATLRDARCSGASCVPRAGGRAENRWRHDGPPSPGEHRDRAAQGAQGIPPGARGHGGSHGQHQVRLHPRAAEAGQGRDGTSEIRGAGGQRPRGETAPFASACRVF